MFYFPGAAHTQFRLKDETIKQGLSQLSGLRRKFVPSRRGQNFFIIIANVT